MSPASSVGHATLIEGDNIRTGVTVIVPHQGNVFQDKVPGAVFVGNAFGKLAGSTQVDELGTIETPIALTNTLSVGAVWKGSCAGRSTSPATTTCVRSTRSSARPTTAASTTSAACTCGPHTSLAALKAATRAARSRRAASAPARARRRSAGRAASAPRRAARRRRYGGYTVGVLVQSNYGGVLTHGRRAGRKDARALCVSADRTQRRRRGPDDERGDGSCMIVVATDAPLDARDLKRLAARAVFGLARTGSSYSNGSGEFAIAFSTAPDRCASASATSARRPRTLLPTDGVSPLFQAALEATEEAVYNSLLKATTVTSRFGKAEALPVDRVREILSRYRVP